MRFPKRIRGLVLGAITLIAGPIVASALTQAPPVAAPAVVPVHLTVAQAQRAVHVVELPRLLRARSPIPPPAAAPPAAAPAPARLPVRHSAPSNPAPAVAPVPADKGGIVAIIMAAAAKWGVSGSWMVSIARCESGLNPRAYNPHGPYIGLFQFLMSTFTHNGGTDIWDPSQQADIAAKMLAHGQAHQWSCA